MELKLQVSDDDAVKSTIEISGFGYERKIRVLAFIVISHVHATIEHYFFAIYRHNNTALAYLLSRP